MQQHKFSRTAKPTAFPHSALFLLSLVSVFFMRKSKRRSASEEQHRYQNILTMFFYSSLYGFNTSKQWPTLVTCNHGILSKPLHVGHYLLQTIHGYWFKSRVWRIHLMFQWEFTLFESSLLSNKHILQVILVKVEEQIHYISQTNKKIGPGGLVSHCSIMCYCIYHPEQNVWVFCLWFSDFWCIGSSLKSVFFYCLQNHIVLS